MCKGFSFFHVKPSEENVWYEDTEPLGFKKTWIVFRTNRSDQRSDFISEEDLNRRFAPWQAQAHMVLISFSVLILCSVYALNPLTSVGTSWWRGQGSGDRRILCWTRLCFLADRMLTVSVIHSEHPLLDQTCQKCCSLYLSNGIFLNSDSLT